MTTEVHRYKAVQIVSMGGSHIGYDPHGPDVVMASAYDELRAQLADRDALLNTLISHPQTVLNNRLRTKALAALSASVEPSVPAERDEEKAFDDWRKEQIASLLRMSCHDAATAFRNLGSVHWTGWQARAALERAEHHG